MSPKRKKKSTNQTNKTLISKPPTHRILIGSPQIPLSIVSPVINILHYHDTFVAINEQIPMHYYSLKFTMYSDFLSFYLISDLLYSRIPSRVPHCIQSSCLLRLLSPWQFLRLFLLTLTVLRGTGQVYCRVPLYWNVSVVFHIIKLGLWVWGRKIIEVK